MSWAIIGDRERYGMLKYIAQSPAPLWSYLVGRGLAGSIEALLGALIALGIGWLLFPELRQTLAGHSTDWGWLLVYLLLGLVMLLVLGLIVAGAVLNMARHGMFLSEGVAGTLYLLSGTVSPITALPEWIQPLSLVLPTTYWMEGMRQALLGQNNLPPLMGQMGHGGLALVLAGTILLLGLLACLFFQWSQQRAWRLGKFDETSGF
jgi:ABC-2 type transport system permease protein